MNLLIIFISFYISKKIFFEKLFELIENENNFKIEYKEKIDLINEINLKIEETENKKIDILKKNINVIFNELKINDKNFKNIFIKNKEINTNFEFKEDNSINSEFYKKIFEKF